MTATGRRYLLLAVCLSLLLSYCLCAAPKSSSGKKGTKKKKKQAVSGTATDSGNQSRKDTKKKGVNDREGAGSGTGASAGDSSEGRKDTKASGPMTTSFPETYPYTISSRTEILNLMYSSKILTMLKENSKCDCEKFQALSSLSPPLDLEIYYVKSRCNICASFEIDSNVSIPTYFELSKSTFDLETSPIAFSIVAYDMFDVAVSLTPEHVKAISVVREGDRKNMSIGIQLKGDMSVDISSDVTSPGVYKVILELMRNEKDVDTVDISFAVTRKINVQDVHIGFTDKKDLEITKLNKLQDQRSAKSSQFQASKDDILHVAFTATPMDIVAHQCFLKFTHIESNKVVNYVFKTSGNYMHIALYLLREAKTFSYKSGHYNVAILMGDTRATEGVEWILGEVSLKFPNKPRRRVEALYKKSLLHESDNTLEALPEIEHMMRPPAQHASLLMSTLFTIFSILPLVGLVAFMNTLDLNLNFLKGKWNLLFILAILSTLLLYVGYWLALPGLDFYQTLKYIFCLVAPVLLITGKYSLSHIKEMKNEVENKVTSQSKVVKDTRKTDKSGESEEKCHTNSRADSELKHNTNVNKGVIRQRK